MESNHEFSSPPNWQTVCPLPPMPDLTSSEHRAYRTVNDGLYQKPVGTYYHRILSGCGKLAPTPFCSAPPSPYQYCSSFDSRIKLSATPLKRGPGRPRVQDSNELKNGAINSTCYTNGNKRGRKSGIKSVCTADGCQPEVRVKRKYTRRVKSDQPKERPITDIIQLTESLEKLLSQTEKRKAAPQALGQLSLYEMENFSWPPMKVQQDSDLDLDDVDTFNNLLKELSTSPEAIEKEKKLELASRESQKDRKVKLLTKFTEKHHVVKVPRKSILNCRKMAMSKCRHSVLKSESVVFKEQPCADTWTCKIGGKCKNKWQLLQKHVLGNNVVKQLREERQTERLIKVLCSTPQRMLRSRAREYDDSFLEISTTSTETDLTDKSSAGWISVKDKSLNLTGQDLAAHNKQENPPVGYFAVADGVCPDIEPTVQMYCNQFSEIYNSQGNAFSITQYPGP